MSFVQNLYVTKDSTTSELRLEDTTDGDYVALVANGTTTTYTLTLPAAQGGSNEVLRNNGSGVLTWEAAGGVDGPGSATDNAIARFDGITGTIIQDSGLGINDANDLIDANGNELINFTATASAVNEIGITNAISGDAPIFSAVSDVDTNINLEYITKGTGVHIFDSSGANATELRLYDTAGSDYVGFKPADSTTSYTLTTPAAVGAIGQVLQTTDGAGTLAWATNGEFDDETFKVSDDGDSTKVVEFELAGATTATTTTLALNQTANRVLTFPDATDVLVARDTTDDLTNKTLIAPIIDEINDANGNELIIFTTTASADNAIGITNAISGDAPILSAVGGTDANINLEYMTKGTGVHIFDSTGANATELRLYDIAGDDYIGIKAADAMTSYTMTMPASQGSTDSMLVNDGSGNLSWDVPKIPNDIATATALATSTSATYALLPGMILTPTAGTYFVTFSGSASKTNNNSSANYAIFINTTITAHSERDWKRGNNGGDIDSALHSQSIETVNGTDTIAVGYKSNAGSFIVAERSLILIRVA
jgi:hypothetical protein